MIKCAGHRISPSEIEEVVFKSEIVKEAAAVGLPDDVAGEIVKVFVVLINDDERKYDDYYEKIIDICADKMPSYMVPKYVEAIKALPKTPVGKIDYPTLRKRAKK
jgi:long-chain acyl-CoA synthetase